jgi:hypothetical protein
MNPHTINNNSSNCEGYQPTTLKHCQGWNTGEEHLLHHVSSGAAEDDDQFWLTATPKVSWDESDGRIMLSPPSCTNKKISLSPPPLIPSNNRINFSNYNNHRSSCGDRIDSVLFLPSLDIRDDLQKPVLRVKKRKSVVANDTPRAQWRLRHRIPSDSLSHTVQPPHPHRPKPPQQKHQQLHCETSPPPSSSVHQRQLTHRKRAVSYDQHSQQPHQHQQQQKQKHCEKGTEEEEDKLIELLQRQRFLLYDHHGQQQQQQHKKQHCF